MALKELSKAYEPQEVEEYWRKYWEEHKCFTPNMESQAEPYSIVIPPPNVTGALHIGHAFNQTLQDILARHARQKAKSAVAGGYGPCRYFHPKRCGTYPFEAGTFPP